MKLSEAHKPKDAIIAAKKYNGARCSDRPDIYGGNAYGELRRQTIWQRIRGIFRR
jgi:hypothetical protein